MVAAAAKGIVQVQQKPSQRNMGAQLISVSLTPIFSGSNEFVTRKGSIAAKIPPAELDVLKIDFVT